MSTLFWSSDNGHMMVVPQPEFFLEARKQLAQTLLKSEPFNAGRWQQLDVSTSKAHDTYELLNLTMWYEMPAYLDDAQDWIEPDLPWAERHFQERVGGKPINPGVEHANWPYHAGKVELHQHGGKYDHNYMERIWPTGLTYNDSGDTEYGTFTGYRFTVGDLNDVVQLLGTEPGTRQAYLPIWFPEDTGATEGQRVPCTLGYHFIIRDGVIHLQYNLRSCEIYRHFTNDVYMAVRLAHWVRDELQHKFDQEYEVGQLTMHMVSFHGFVGDTEKIGEL